MELVILLMLGWAIWAIALVCVLWQINIVLGICAAVLLVYAVYNDIKGNGRR